MMNKTLGIYVTSDRHLEKLIQLCRAAKKKGVFLKLFFTHLGTRLAIDDRLIELTDLADVAFCKVGFEDYKLKFEDAKFNEKGFASQSWHAEMVYDCDRYITF